MQPVYVISHNIYSPLGNTTSANFRQLQNGISSVKHHAGGALSNNDVYASLFLDEQKSSSFTFFEHLLLSSIEQAIASFPSVVADDRTLLIISTTKGNIDFLESNKSSAPVTTQVGLNRSAQLIASHFGFKNDPLVVSNACISGLTALITAKRLINASAYDHVIVAGADRISRFILSGFESFQALSPEICRPFDEERKGINLGEAASTIILSSDKRLSMGIVISGGSTTNDANHISGPSRTGEELSLSIQRTMRQAHLTPTDISYVSAHGTGTLYNDEMEAKAISLAGLQDTPINSLKGYFGHTLGAAGILESTVAIESMLQNTLIPSLGYRRHGVSKPLNIIQEGTTTNIDHCLKTASGFGGCNASVIFSKQ